MRDLLNERDEVVKVKWQSALTDVYTRPAGLKGIDINVALVLSTFANGIGSEPFWPAERTIAEAAGRSRTTVRESLDKLDRMGLISRDTGRRGVSTRYYLEDWTVHFGQRPTILDGELGTESGPSSW